MRTEDHVLHVQRALARLGVAEFVRLLPPECLREIAGAALEAAGAQIGVYGPGPSNSGRTFHLNGSWDGACAHRPRRSGIGHFGPRPPCPDCLQEGCYAIADLWVDRETFDALPVRSDRRVVMTSGEIAAKDIASVQAGGGYAGLYDAAALFDEDPLEDP